jgi:ornithine carbamoyltransferase
LADFISVADFSQKEIWDVLILAQELKKNKISQALRGKSVGLIFQKPSTRTAVSFAVGVAQLGGQPLILSADILQIKRGESPRDTSRVLSRYLDAIVIRANKHDDVVEMSGYSSIPIINGLTDMEHPCQVLADLLTIMEHRKLKHPKDLKGLKLAYFGDGNNMAHSLVLASGLLGFDINLACPAGYGPKKHYIDRALDMPTHGKIKLTTQAEEAALKVDALYTDVWVSMGQEDDGKKQKAFLPFQVNQKLLSLASPQALVMHCLPAHRGEEITEDVLEGPQSVVFDQAENRLHVQKAILVTLLSDKKKS